MNNADWERLAQIRARIDACARGPVTLCAATKGQPAERVNALWPALTVLGENRVQEYLQKIDALNSNFQLHMIGQLQTNKVKYVINTVMMVQSLDREALAEELQTRAKAVCRRIPVLIQVNIANESQKAGVSEAKLSEFLSFCAAKPNLDVQGLMAIMPLQADAEQNRPYFRRMRALFDGLRGHAPEHVHMNVLSMGMSADYLVAVEEGSNMVRLGSAIFGDRV